MRGPCPKHEFDTNSLLSQHKANARLITILDGKLRKIRGTKDKKEKTSLEKEVTEIRKKLKTRIRQLRRKRLL